MTIEPTIEPHAYDTEEERDARNDTLYDVMDQFTLRGEAVPGWIGTMVLPHKETCPEAEEAAELYRELHKTGDRFQ